VAADYARLIAECDLARKVEAGVIDEVWLFAYPYAGYYESRMAGPGAFWCSAPPLSLPRDRLPHAHSDTAAMLLSRFTSSSQWSGSSFT